jgi:hypothetical protein
MVLTSQAPAPFQAGYRLFTGDGLNNALAKDLVSSTDGITAFATGGATNATQLFTVINRVTVVANANDSVKLPASIPGMSVTVDNDGSNSLNVYPFGTDQIEDSTNPISLIAGEDAVFVCPVVGKWYQLGTSGQFSGTFSGIIQETANAAVTAAGTTQGGATATTGNIVNVTTGTANQGILLPVTANNVAVINGTGNTIKVYPATAAGTIDGGSAGAAVTLTSAHRGATFYNVGADVWTSSLFGAVSS